MTIFVDNLDADQLSVLATAVAISISKGLNPTQINILAGFIDSVGDLLGLIASKQQSLSTTDS